MTRVTTPAPAMPDAPRPSTSLFTSLVVAVCVAGAVGLVVGGRPPEAAADAGSRTEAPATPTSPPFEPVPTLAPPASASSHAPPRPARTKRACSIAAVGDSLTDSRSHGGGYLAYLARRCPKSRIDNHGKGADMVNQMRRRFTQQVLGGPPGPGQVPSRYTHVVIFGGVNDLYSDLTAGRTPPKIAEDLLWMYTQARARGMQVVAVTVAPWGGFRKYYNERRGESTQRLNRWIADQFDAGTVDYVVDAYSLLSCGNPELLCPEYAKPFRDGIHFGPAGHDQLGEALFEQVFRDCL